MTLFISMIFISFYQFIMIYGQDIDENPMNDNIFGLSSSNDDWFSEDFTNRLNDFAPGNTVSFANLANIITDSRTATDAYEVQFSPRITDFFDSQILIGQLSNINQIVNVQMSFHNDDGDIIRDKFGNPIAYTSNRQDLGHVLDILHPEIPFSYIRCLLRLQPNSNFDPHSLFFHFAQRSPLGKPTNDTYVITGPTSFSIDTNQQIYNVSANCPLGLTCMWLLDNEVISGTPNTTVGLVFSPRHVGNRTLTYVGYSANNPQILASLQLSILPSSSPDCSPLPRAPRNIWLQARPMSTPRVYFTMTYLSQSGYLMMAGGSTDGSTGLSLVDIYNPLTGCYNVLNMSSPRMRHKATYYNNSDAVLLIGGVRKNNDVISASEIISINATQVHYPMTQPRYFHEMHILNNSNILIVSGQGLINNLIPLEMYDRASSTFQTLAPFHSRLQNLEGHSVTSLGSTGNLLIFGGFNGSSYSGVGLIYNGTNLTSAGPFNITALDTINDIPGRAHHQATYIPLINAVLITGGDNGTHALSDAYLYDIVNRNFTATASMGIPRSFHKATLHSNGSVIITGGAVGMSGNQPITPTNSVEMYNPSTRTFTSAPLLNVARYRHQAALFEDEVFVSGGIGSDGRTLSSNEYLIF
ncbi:unnamed protein product [Rotaria sp. Silwood1]|nr:unnamed protein product [Rotaria sp. Silwood1]